MTIAEFFASNRDSHGRAWLPKHCWIEQAIGCFRLNTPNGEFPFLGTDHLEAAESLASKVSLQVEHDTDEGEPVQLDKAESATDTATQAEFSFGDAEVSEIDLVDDGVADQFDEFRGGGAWPGPSADDAESGDFEDSLGDLSEDGYDDGPQDE